MDNWISSRPEAYDPALVYDGENEGWTDDADILMRSSGRYFNNIMVFGIDEDGEGKISIYPFFESPVVEAGLKDYYQTGDDYSVAAQWALPDYAIGQTFTASKSYSLTKIGLKLLRTTDPTTIGTVTLNLYATTGVPALPTGDSLATGTIDGDEVTTEGDGEWVEITLTSPVSVVSGTKYAIVINTSVTNLETPELTWRGDITAPAYDNGAEVYKYEGLWAEADNVDFMFRCYGI